MSNYSLKQCLLKKWELNEPIPVYLYKKYSIKYEEVFNMFFGKNSYIDFFNDKENFRVHYDEILLYNDFTTIVVSKGDFKKDYEVLND